MNIYSITISKLNLMLKNNSGYVLPSVLFISLLVTTLLFGILSIIFFYNSTNQKLINKTKLDLACFSGLQKFISKEQPQANDKFLIGKDSIQVEIQNKMNGLFAEVEVTATNNNDSSKVIYLLANKVNDIFENAIIISKEKLRASVAGSTMINGNMLLTSEKIKLGRISGIKSASKNYLIGEIMIREDIKVKLFKDSLILNQINNQELVNSSIYIDGNFELNNETITSLTENKTTRINGDLLISGKILAANNSTQINLFVSGKVIIADESNLTTNLRIVSDSSITIEKDVDLENSVLVSNGIISIKSNTQLKNVQLFSMKGVEVKKAEFKYPSVLALYSDLDQESNLENKIIIESSIINGSILLVNSITGLSNNKNLIDIDTESHVQGLVYSENNCKIAGEVDGIIYTHSFWYYKEPTEYINWLVDVKVDRNKLDQAFLIPLGLTDVNKLNILKETWIN